MDKNSSSARLPEKADHDNLLVELAFLRAVEGRGVNVDQLMEKILLIFRLNSSSLILLSDLGWTLPEYINLQTRLGYIVREGTKVRLTPAGWRRLQELIQEAEDKNITVFPQVIIGSFQEPL